MKFLIKEIRSKTGELHFRRYRIFSCPLFSIFIHKIYKSDEDFFPHNHPWNFISIILSGGYEERLIEDSTTVPKDSIWFDVAKKKICKPFSILFRSFKSYHKIYLLKPTTTLVFTGRRLNDNWGYFIAIGDLCNQIWFTASEYREFKNKVEKETEELRKQYGSNGAAV